MISALIYVSYNITLVLSSFLGTYKDKSCSGRQLWCRDFCALFTMWFITVVNFVSLSDVQYYMVARRQKFYAYASVSMLFSAMITTLCL